MKVLYISDGNSPDYQCDVLFHGLRSLLGPNLVELNHVWHMYESSFRVDGRQKEELYGRGFSLYGTLPDCPVDHSRIEEEIANHSYDFIVFGSLLRCQTHLMTVIQHYSPEDILFIDGEDHHHLIKLFLNRGLYFKRELEHPHPGVFPIHFGIPKEKILPKPTPKTRVLAHMDPNDPSTYIYDTEEAYYGGYQESLLGLTSKKAGWDCMRHYEILANRCVPLFTDIDDCPALTLHRLPKIEISFLKSIYKDLKSRGEESFLLAPEGRAVVDHYEQVIHKAFVEHCTTEAVAKHVIRTWQAVKASRKSRDSQFLFMDPEDRLSWEAA